MSKTTSWLKQFAMGRSQPEKDELMAALSAKEDDSEDDVSDGEDKPAIGAQGEIMSKKTEDKDNIKEKADISAVTEQLEEMRASLGEIMKTNAALATQLQKYKESASISRNQKISAEVSSLIQAGVITPAGKDKLIEFAASLEDDKVTELFAILGPEGFVPATANFLSGSISAKIEDMDGLDIFGAHEGGGEEEISDEDADGVADEIASM